MNNYSTPVAVPPVLARAVAVIDEPAPAVFVPRERRDWAPQRYDELTQTAIHEAGHAVMAYLLGHPFRRVTVIPNEAQNSAGAMHRTMSALLRPDREIDTRARLRAEDEVIICFAGAETQRRWLAWSTHHRLDIDAEIAESAAWDMEWIDSLTWRLSRSVSVQAPLREWLRQRTVQYISGDSTYLDQAARYRPGKAVHRYRARYWILVFALAKELTCTGTVTWRQARELLDPLLTCWTEQDNDKLG